MKPISILWYAIALFAPIIYFTVLTNNTNETQHVLAYVVCISLFAGAGWLSSAGFVMKARYKWIGASLLAGLAEALLLIYAV